MASAQSACEVLRRQEQTRHRLGRPGTDDIEVEQAARLPDPSSRTNR